MCPPSVSFAGVLLALLEVAAAVGAAWFQLHGARVSLVLIKLARRLQLLLNEYHYLQIQGGRVQ